MKQLTEINTPFASFADSSLIGQDKSWLQTLRQTALQQFERHGLPSRKQEDWKYTSLWELGQQTFSHSPAEVVLTNQQCEQVALLESAYRIVIVDGIYVAALSQLDNLETGLSIAPLSASLDSVEPYLNQQVDVNKAGLNALNTLLMNEGAVINVAANAHIEKPIELLIINSGRRENLATHLRNMVILEEGAQATLVEHYVGLQQNVPGFTDVVTEVVLAEKAILNHYKLQQESACSFHIATMAARQAAGSLWHTNNIALGGKLARTDLHSRLLGEQAHTTMDGLYLVKDEQLIDNHTRIDHEVPNTTSEEVYKGVLDGASHAIFNGKVIVHKDAQKTDANQSNCNLLLSRNCEIDSKPEMEIYADDVKCGHGSTVGQLDEDQLFFLRARGLDEVTARSLLTYAFAVEVLERIPAENIRQPLSNVIEQRLPRKGNA